MDIGNVTFSWRDVVDIALVTALFYRIILFVRGTRAVSAIYGLLSLAIIYVIARAVGLNTLEWLLEHLFGSIFLVIVVLFQQDIRRALSEMGMRRLFSKSVKADPKILDMVANAAEAMAESRIGALIVFERNMPLGDMLQEGVSLNAKISPELLLTIFKPKTPLHDGAVIIRNNLIAAASCILPLASSSKHDFGTRHRAGLGITQETDAVAIVVSEERGQVTIAVGGKLSKPIGGERLNRALHAILER